MKAWIAKGEYGYVIATGNLEGIKDGLHNILTDSELYEERRKAFEAGYSDGYGANDGELYLPDIALNKYLQSLKQGEK